MMKLLSIHPSHACSGHDNQKCKGCYMGWRKEVLARPDARISHNIMNHIIERGPKLGFTDLAVAESSATVGISSCSKLLPAGYNTVVVTTQNHMYSRVSQMTVPEGTTLIYALSATSQADINEAVGFHHAYEPRDHSRLKHAINIRLDDIHKVTGKLAELKAFDIIHAIYPKGVVNTWEQHEQCMEGLQTLYRVLGNKVRPDSCLYYVSRGDPCDYQGGTVLDIGATFGLRHCIFQEKAYARLDITDEEHTLEDITVQLKMLIDKAGTPPIKEGKCRFMKFVSPPKEVFNLLDDQ